MASTRHTRIRHFIEALWRPMWSWLFAAPLGVLAFAALLRDEFLPAETAKGLKVLALLPHWPWQAYALLFFIALLGVVFEGSFRVVKRVEEERDEAKNTLADISVDRCVSFLSIDPEIEMSNPPGNYYLRRLYMRLGNNSNRMMTYTVHVQKVTLDGLDISEDFTDPNFVLRWSYISEADVASILVFDSKPKIEDSSEIVIAFTILYNDVRATRERQSMKEVKYKFVQAFPPRGSYEFLIESETLSPPHAI